jgi:hypothetical protein
MERSGVSVDDDGVVRYVIDPDSRTAEFDLLSGIAEVEGVALDELPSLYATVDHFVEGLYDDPPASAAHVELSFSYAGYRVNVDQAGHVRLVPVKESMGGDDSGDSADSADGGE